MLFLDYHIDKYILADTNKNEAQKENIKQKALDNYVNSYAASSGKSAKKNKHKYNPFTKVKKVNNPAIVTSFNKRVEMRRVANKEAAFIQDAKNRVIRTRNSVMVRAARRGDIETLHDMGQSSMAEDVRNTGLKKLKGNISNVPVTIKYKKWHTKQQKLQPRKARDWSDSRSQYGGRKKKTRRYKHSKSRKHGKKKSRKSRKRNKKKSRKRKK